MIVWNVKLIPSELNSSNAIRAGIGQRGLPMREVISVIEEVISKYPQEQELVLRVEIQKDKKFSISTLGPTATQLIKNFKRKKEGFFTAAEALEIYNENPAFWNERTTDPSKALLLVKGSLRSFKEGYSDE